MESVDIIHFIKVIFQFFSVQGTLTEVVYCPSPRSTNEKEALAITRVEEEVRTLQPAQTKTPFYMCEPDSHAQLCLSAVRGSDTGGQTKTGHWLGKMCALKL